LAFNERLKKILDIFIKICRVYPTNLIQFVGFVLQHTKNSTVIVYRADFTNGSFYIKKTCPFRGRVQ